jgi:hypothetical protein
VRRTCREKGYSRRGADAASIEGRNPVLQERAMTSREGAIGRDEINATGKSGVEWAVVFFAEADFDGSQSNVCRET